MIAKISSGKSFGGLVGYNEKNVASGSAELIGIENIASPNVIKETLEQVDSFNPICQKPTFHVSLSFPPNEMTLDNATLQAIANEFMQGLGYKDNPYAIYRYYDADNQHIHIVSTRIDWNGKRIKRTERIVNLQHKMKENTEMHSELALEKNYRRNTCLFCIKVFMP